MIRIVKMHFRNDKTESFLELFEEVFPKISSSPGCNKLELLRDKNDPSIFFTYSFWNTPDDLESYRNSELFKSTWIRTKALFAHNAEAWSVEREMQF